MAPAPSDLRRVQAGEQARLHSEAAALRRQAEATEATARRLLAGGDKAAHNMMMMMAHNMRMKALLAERHLPAKLGAKSSAAHAIAAAATRKLWPNDINKIKAEYARRLGLGERHGAIADLAAQYGVSTKTISRYVKPKAKGK